MALRLSIAVSLAILPATAQQANPSDLAQLSLEDLMKIQVTTVSKKEQNLWRTGAAVFVITQEDIHRSGATNIPDLLRIAPGVDVGRLDANRWAISVRGFNDEYANKVLVLIDGRSVYSSTVSGVFWDTQDVPLEDIDRIEIVRGPGGTVWGANAVNGVINIITKSSSATQGGLLVAGGGSENNADGLIQYGGKIGPGTYRVFGHYFHTGSSDAPAGGNAFDGWQSAQGGFRSDWAVSPSDSLTVLGDFLNTHEAQSAPLAFSSQLPRFELYNDRFTKYAGDVLGRWKHIFRNGSDLTVQLYDDYQRRHEMGFHELQNTLDLDLQHHIALGLRNDVVWGFGARSIQSRYRPGYALDILPHERNDFLGSGFVQDEFRLTDWLSLTAGSKVEHNAFTGWEFEPGVQIVWTPSPRHTVWASAARAIRQPSILEFGINSDFGVTPTGAPYGPSFVLVHVSGNSRQQTESLVDAEFGYRVQLSKALTLDLAAFTGFYDNLETSLTGDIYPVITPQLQYLVLPLRFANQAGAHTYGAEFSANWKASPRVRFSPTYSYFHMNVDGDTGALLTTPGMSPAHQFQVRSLIDLRRNLEWDSAVGYVSRLPAPGFPAYVRIDTRLGWRVGESTELSIVGQNLESPRHPEFYNPLYSINYTLVERSIFAKATWRF